MDLPCCPNFKRGACERNDPVLLTDDGEYYQFGCRTCRCGYVLTKPVGKARARYENEIARQASLRMTERDRVVFGAPKKGWITA